MSDDVDQETAGFTRYTLPNPESDASGDLPGTLYTTTVPEGAGQAAQGGAGSADVMSSPSARAALGGPRPDETVNDFVTRRNREEVAGWERPADFSEADEAAFQLAAGKLPGDATPEEAAAYNQVAGLNLGTQDRAGMDTVEAFESQAQMYTQVDDA